MSLLTGATVPTHVAMTGEVTLRGRVTPVGGIKEKVGSFFHVKSQFLFSHSYDRSLVRTERESPRSFFRLATAKMWSMTLLVKSATRLSLFLYLHCRKH